VYFSRVEEKHPVDPSAKIPRVLFPAAAPDEDVAPDAVATEFEHEE